MAHIQRSDDSLISRNTLTFFNKLSDLRNSFHFVTPKIWRQSDVQEALADQGTCVDDLKWWQHLEDCHQGRIRQPINQRHCTRSKGAPVHREMRNAEEITAGTGRINQGIRHVGCSPASISEPCRKIYHIPSFEGQTYPVPSRLEVQARIRQKLELNSLKFS